MWARNASSSSPTLILIFAQQPKFKLHALGVSTISAGKEHKDAVRWKQNIPTSKDVGKLVVKECYAIGFQDCDLAFSSLARDIGMSFYPRELYDQVIEQVFRNRVRPSQSLVFSNAKNYHRDPRVGLVMPTVNLSHLDIIPYQRSF